MEENQTKIAEDFPENSFHRLFWKQQQEALKVKNNRQLRWHPMMVKWCLHLKMISSAAYHAMRSSGFIKLPSERTLRDYTHLVKAATGIQPDVNAQIIKYGSRQVHFFLAFLHTILSATVGAYRRLSESCRRLTAVGAFP